LTTNVEPFEQVVTHFLGLIDDGVSLGSLTLMAAEAPQNLLNIDFVGLNYAGLAYEVYGA
jgi:hypothetical protein